MAMWVKLRHRLYHPVHCHRFYLCPIHLWYLMFLGMYYIYCSLIYTWHLVILGVYICTLNSWRIDMCLCLLYSCSSCSFNYFDLLSIRPSWPASPYVSCPVFHLCLYLSFFFTLYWFHCYFIFHYYLIWADPEWPVLAPSWSCNSWPCFWIEIYALLQLLNFKGPYWDPSLYRWP